MSFSSTSLFFISHPVDYILRIYNRGAITASLSLFNLLSIFISPYRRFLSGVFTFPSLDNCFALPLFKVIHRSLTFFLTVSLFTFTSFDFCVFSFCFWLLFCVDLLFLSVSRFFLMRFRCIRMIYAASCSFYFFTSVSSL